MKSLIVLISILLCLVLNHKKNSSNFNLAGLFIVVWGGCGLLSSLSFFGLYRLSASTIILIVMALVVFSFIDLLFPPVNRDNLCYSVNLMDSDSEEDYVLSNSVILLVINLIAYAFSIPYLLKAITLIANGGFSLLRQYAFVGSSEFASTRALTVFQDVINPLFVATMIITAIDLSLSKRAIKGLALTLIGVLLYTILFGGRYMLFQTIIVFFAAFYISSGTSIKAFIKNHKNMLFLISLLAVLVAGLTNYRSSGSLAQNAYLYFCGSFHFLDVLIKDPSFSSMLLLGKATFGFIYDFIVIVLSLSFGLSPYFGANYQITQVTGYPRFIGVSQTYNSLGTMYTSFIPDFGIWGSVLGVIIFAIFVSVVQDRFIRRPTYLKYSILLLTIYSVVNSVLSYSFLKVGMLILFVLLFVFSKRIRIRF